MMRRPMTWAFAVLALVLLLSGLSAGFVNQLVMQQQRTRFMREVDTVTLGVEQRLAAYIEVLRAARGLWGVSAQVSRDDFARYVDVLELQRQYPGLQGLGYAEYVRPRELPGFQARQRAQGVTGFSVRPPGARAAYVPVTYLEPRNEANTYALGFDMYSEPTRRAAIERAIRDGDAAATGPVTLVQERRLSDAQRGFLIYLPVYQDGASLRSIEERRAALQGFLYAPLRIGDFLSGVGARGRYGQIALSVWDGGQVMFGKPENRAAFRDTRTLNVAGQTWTLSFTAPATFGQDYFTLTPWVVLLLGLVIALAAFYVTRAQVTARMRAEDMRARLARTNASLSESRAEFEAMFRAMQDTAVFADPGGRVRLSNDALSRTFGYTPAELRGQNLASLHADGQLAALGDFAAVATTYRRKDGSEFVGEAQRSFVRSESGEVIGQLEVVRDMTERLEADRALRESELRYRGVLEAMPQLVWVTDPQGRHLYYNSGWYEFTGLSHEDSLGYGFALALHPDDLERTMERWERSWKYGEPYEIEYRFRRKDGEYHWFVGRASPILGASGEVIEWVGTCTDINERIAFEGQLRRSEARYRGLIEGMPQVVWLAGPTGDTTYFNRRWAEYVGEANAAKGLGPAVLHPGDRADFEARWQHSLRTGTPFEGEYRLLSAGGEYRTFIARGLPVFEREGEVIEWVGTLTDVEDQVYAEASSRMLAELSRLLAVPLGETRDITGVLQLYTARFAEAAALWLADGDELLSASETRPHVNLNVLEEQREMVESFVRRIMRDGESEVVASSERLREIGLSSVLAVPLIARGDAVLGALVLGYRHPVEDRDTELAHEVAARVAIAVDNQRLFVQARDAERELTELNQTLEARVEARTHELQEANRELEAFSYSVSHDLRTPLRHVVGFGDLLRKESEGKLSDKGLRYLAIITDAATRMSTLIDDLLSFSRMGRQEMRFVKVDLGDLVREAQAELAPDLSPRVVWHIGELPTIDADPSLLKLALINLFANALKYSRTREKSRIDVSATTDGHEVIIGVRDNGVGFDSRFADKLFGVFQRLHRAEEFEGTGIGLANVRRIVSRHGGRVWAESTLGEGATFYVALPVHQHEELMNAHPQGHRHD